MKYKAVLFDMDGTVLDTLTDIANAVNYSFRSFGIPEVPKETIMLKLGNGAERLVRGSLPYELPEDDFRSLLGFYNTWYNDHSIVETAPYPGITDLMSKLDSEGCKTVIVSNKPDPTVKLLAERFFLGMPAVGERPGIARKPAPDSVLSVLRELGIAPEDAAYIGDTEVDILTAKNAGTHCIAVSWGFRPRSVLENAGAELICDSVEELSALLR